MYFFKAFLIAVILALVTSCGVKIKSDPVRVEVSKIEVDHKVTINPDTLRLYYLPKCQLELGPTAADEDINTCVEQKVVDFNEAFKMATIPTST